MQDKSLKYICGFSFMASERERTAYLYRVPVGTSESSLRLMLNNSRQSDYSIHVIELKQGVAVLKIFGNGLYYTVCLVMYCI